MKFLEKCLVHSKYSRSVGGFLLFLFVHLHQLVAIFKISKTAKCLTICKLHFYGTCFEKDCKRQKTYGANPKSESYKLEN